MTYTSTPSTIAIIPARGGSRRLPQKNLLPVDGLPLIAHSVRHAVAAKAVETVYVSTDHKEIASISENHGATIIWRPAELAGSTASSESALLHVLDVLAAEGNPDSGLPELVVFLQCTSPVRTDDDIDQAIAKLLEEKADSLLSVCDNKRFLWRHDKDSAISINYDFHARQREQDMAPQFQENGSIYITRTSLLRETGNRLGGKIALHLMDYWSSFQIDDPEDMELIEWIMQTRVK